jgi:hypothetical protein
VCSTIKHGVRVVFLSNPKEFDRKHRLIGSQSALYA